MIPLEVNNAATQTKVRQGHKVTSITPEVKSLHKGGSSTQSLGTHRVCFKG